MIQKYIRFLGFVFFVGFSLVQPSEGAVDVLVHSELRDQITIRFYKGGLISSKKIQVYKQEIQTRKAEVLKLLKEYYLSKGKEISAAEQKASENKVVRSYDVLEGFVDELSLASSEEKALSLAAQILELDFSTKQIGSTLLTERLYELFNWSLKSWVIPRRADVEKEATILDSEFNLPL